MYIGGYSPLINFLLTYWDKDTQQQKMRQKQWKFGNGWKWWTFLVKRKCFCLKDVETKKPTLKKFAKEVTSESEETEKADSPTFVAHGRNHSYPKKGRGTKG